MSIQLTPQAEAWIHQKVTNGLYESAEEAITAAVRLLDDRDRRLQTLRESITEGFAAIERGDGTELTPDLMDAIERDAEDASRRGETPHPDAGP